MSEAKAQSASLTIKEFFERVPERALFVVIGFLQGAIAAGLTESETWLQARPPIYFSLWLLVLAWPLLFMLSFRHGDRLRAVAWVSGFSVPLVLLALYTGWQATPYGEFSELGVRLVFAQTMLFANFVALLHLQANVWRMEPNYDTFFTLSWRNFVTVGLSAALTLSLRLVLFVWGALFKAIGIKFFDDLFEKEWFLWPVLAAVFAFGLSSFRDATSVIDSVSSLLVRLTWLLLPLLLFVIAAFLSTLPFVGLQPLWDTDNGTSILMIANLLGLLFLNAVYQTGERIPYPAWMHRALTVGIALLPILSVLASYGIALRVGQYGWTVQRCWALLIVLLMACFSSGYLYVIIRARAAWHGGLPQINQFMSWVVLASLLLTASPLANFRAISAWSQFGPIEAGAASIEQLDVDYVKTSLARPGYLRMQSLLAELDESNPVYAQRLRAALEDEASRLPWSAEQRGMTVRRPDTLAAPDGLWDYLQEIADPQIAAAPPRFLVLTDLDANDRPEYVAIWLHDHGAETSIFAECVYESSGGDWRRYGSDVINSEQSMDFLLEELAEADIEAVIPSRMFLDLRIGDWVFDLRPE
ncbi:DUF4153 domain-containing protein [Candidatus Foliamicus sp.]